MVVVPFGQTDFYCNPQYKLQAKETSLQFDQQLIYFLKKEL